MPLDQGILPFEWSRVFSLPSPPGKRFLQNLDSCIRGRDIPNRRSHFKWHWNTIPILYIFLQISPDFQFPPRHLRLISKIVFVTSMFYIFHLALVLHYNLLQNSMHIPRAHSQNSRHLAIHDQIHLIHVTIQEYLLLRPVPHQNSPFFSFYFSK